MIILNLYTIDLEALFLFDEFHLRPCFLLCSAVVSAGYNFGFIFSLYSKFAYCILQSFKLLWFDMFQEEHYVSKLLFAWPQVACMSGFPARGSRAVFASYRDSLGQVSC